MERYLGSGFLLCWITHVLVAVLLLGSVPEALTQSGFLNIDCGATSSYVDSATGLSWEPDAPYISSGKTQTLTLPSSLQSFTEMQTLRYFDDARAKNCYALPVTHNASYLLKLTFFYGNYDNANLPPKFQVAIDANIVSNITVGATAFSYTEYHYLSRGNFTFVCFLRTSPGAAPFISGISLKQARILADSANPRYSTKLQEGIIFSTLSRVNFGGTALIRAPYDHFDRFWFPEGPKSFYYLTPQIADHEFLSTSISIPFKDYSWPPSAVMQSAVISSRTGSIRSYLLPEGSPAIESSFFFYLYYAQLNSSSNPPRRNFTITIPAITTEEFTAAPFYDNNFLDYFGYEYMQLDKLLDTSTTLILTPFYNSEAGPILNGMEVFATSGERIAKTGARNALAIEDIKKSYNLTEWTGDPCLPSPHAWITCSIPDPTANAPEPVITAVNLSGYRLVGTLQASFANLRDLISLDLSNNGLSGQLPEWLTSMTALRHLAVQNNNFSGPIPEGLRSANLLVFTYDGNPFLGDQPAPGAAITKCSNCGISNIAIIASAGAGGVVGITLLTVIAILVCCRCRRKRKHSHGHRAGMRIATPGGAKAYTFAEVTAATTQFKRELGRGGFGPVYYGKLPGGQEVAVKVADGNSIHEERAFFNEVDVLSRVHHKNLVALVGYCQEQKQILIYEYVHNGSLFDHLHGSSVSTGILDWRMRLNIALNAAQGLEYLHTACRPSFIHRDVKSSNILLTPQFEAKVADFGLTKLLGEDDGTRVLTNNVMGTLGYLDPEYYTSNYISSKSDVYSFGIVLLELITGGLPIEKSSLNGRDPNIVNWVRENLQNNDITSILDPLVTTSNPNMEAVWKVVDVAMRSVELKGVHRPTMTEVVQELQGALALATTNVQSTQEPALHSTQPSGISDSSSGSYGPTSFPTPR